MSALLGDTINHFKEKTCFFCPSESHFEVDLSKLKMKKGCSLTFILNFRISTSKVGNENPEKTHISNLISLNFRNEYTITLIYYILYFY